MEKIKRAERLAVMGQVLTASPNRIFTLSYFCDLFSTAKSTVSEDVAMLAQTYQTFSLGCVETVTGAAGGVGDFPIAVRVAARALRGASGRVSFFFGFCGGSGAGVGHGRADRGPVL